MAKKDIDILIVGSHCNLDLAFAEAISSKGLTWKIVRHFTDEDVQSAELPRTLRSLEAGRIVTHAGSLAFFRECQRARCVVSFTGAIIWALRYLWFLLPVMPFPPIVNYVTGSDITELAVERGIRGILYRQMLRRVAFTVLLPYPHAISNAIRLGLSNVAFLRFPFLLNDSGVVGHRSDGPVTYLHASNLDWGEIDSGPGRNSKKGNDRFLRAFIRAAKAGADVRCIILDRGSDRTLAREMVESSGVATHFDWRPPTTQAGLGNLFSEVDVIVDQFEVGGFGGIAMEGMAHGRAVMIYLDRHCLSLLYDSKPPVLNCQSEDEIYECIVGNQDREGLIERGKASREWVMENHGAGKDLDELLLRVSLASGHAWARQG